MTIHQVKMAELAARFAARAAEERKLLATAKAACDRDLLRDRAHNLAGVAPMFGHADIGSAALELEAVVENGEPFDAALASLDLLLRQLERTG